MSRFSQTLLVSQLALLFAAPAAASCGATFCTLNGDWRALGVWNEPGLQADVRYDFIDQDRPRAGSKRVAVGQIPRLEDEVRTLNHNVLLDLAYNFSDGWGLSLQLPWVSRKHEHILNTQDGAEMEHWDISDLGDARITLRMPLVKDSGFGLSLGLKLPTGRTTATNSAGELAERTLQPGSGSTDTVLGLTYHSRPSHDAISWFGQTSWQHAVTTRDAYQPGDRYSLDVGGRYAFNQDWSGIVQANFQLRARDSGANAEPEDSGGRVLYISPGIAGPNTQIYAFVQLPVYTYVDGVQLTVGKSLSVGIGHRF
jgi:hypothetical protein